VPRFAAPMFALAALILAGGIVAIALDDRGDDEVAAPETQQPDPQGAGDVDPVPDDVGDAPADDGGPRDGTDTSDDDGPGDDDTPDGADARDGGYPADGDVPADGPDDDVVAADGRTTDPADDTSTAGADGDDGASGSARPARPVRARTTRRRWPCRIPVAPERWPGSPCWPVWQPSADDTGSRSRRRPPPHR
jgi:hypothetical protein